MRTVLLVFLALSLGACQRANRAGCPSQDLSSIGRDEAARGLPAALPKTDCALDAAELKSYSAGRELGLQRYCQAESGYKLGLDGHRVELALCSEDAAKELQRGFEIGDNLRKFLRKRDDLLTQARDAEQVAATLSENSPQRRTLEDQAAGLRFDARQQDNEVEALRGIVAVEKWR